MPKQLVFQIKEELGDVIFNMEEKSPRRIYLSVHKADIRQAAAALCQKFGARFSIASAIDNIKNFEIIYHFSFDNLGKIVSVRTFIDRDAPQIDSIVPAVKEAAEWIEREMHELFGIVFIGHPGLGRLLLSDEWPKGVYPLRKDYKTNS